MNDEGHRIRFSVSRGPLNIASYLMGTTEFALPYFKEIYSRNVNIKFLHNDANCLESVKYLPEMGVNLFNMGFDTDLNLLKEMCGNKVTMLGNIPPRDVLAQGSVDDVEAGLRSLFNDLDDRSRVIFSCGGGMPPDVSSENLKAFIQATTRF